MRSRISAFRALTASALCAIAAVLSGCPSPSPTPGPDVKPDGFGNLSDKTLDVMRKARAGVDVASERLDANDIPGAKKALDVTKPLLPPAVASDLDWFRKLCDPSADLAALTKAKADNAALLAEVQALQIKVANGISPEEAARRVKQAKDDEAALQTKIWRNRVLIGLGTALAVAAVAATAAAIYLRGKLLGAIAAACAAFSAFFFWLPGFLESENFKRFETALCWILGAGALVVVGAFAYEVVRWLRTAKASRVSATLGAGVKAAM